MEAHRLGSEPWVLHMYCNVFNTLRRCTSIVARADGSAGVYAGRRARAGLLERAVARDCQRQACGSRVAARSAAAENGGALLVFCRHVCSTIRYTAVL